MTDQSKITAAEISASCWLNCEQPLSLHELRGKVVVIHAFQMLCPGCVSHGLPQAGAIYQLYPEDQLQVIGLHSVFEHHQVMTVDALKVFLAEYRIRFPVAVDTPAKEGPIPLTMQAYQLRGTPSLILIDRTGKVRLTHFGRLSDMQVGSFIGQMLQDGDPSYLDTDETAGTSVSCIIRT